ncbi:hypothetical protein V6V47_26085 [Micromonospora sp. CPCC 205539]|uniref:hypothetical protein n=1 Tax=Micromonospora sp. CPCC 205539 TaxID=3122408 RepID=UPI002FEF557A
MTNTGNDRSLRQAGSGQRNNTGRFLLTVLAAWVVTLVLWLAAGGERTPGDLGLLVLLLAIPFLVWPAARAAGRWVDSRERGREKS